MGGRADESDPPDCLGWDHATGDARRCFPGSTSRASCVFFFRRHAQKPRRHGATTKPGRGPSPCPNGHPCGPAMSLAGAHARIFSPGPCQRGAAPARRRVVGVALLPHQHHQPRHIRARPPFALVEVRARHDPAPWAPSHLRARSPARPSILTEARVASVSVAVKKRKGPQGLLAGVSRPRSSGIRGSPTKSPSRNAATSESKVLARANARRRPPRSHVRPATSTNTHKASVARQPLRKPPALFPAEAPSQHQSLREERRRYPNPPSLRDWADSSAGTLARPAELSP